MFQNTATEMGELQNILQDELDSFASVLQISQKIVKQVESLPISTLSTMVNFRQEWIEKINLLEEKRKALEIEDAQHPLIQEYMEKISELAKQLVEIDDKIYSNLQSRKLKFVQEHSTIAAEMGSNKKQSKNLGGSSKVDIVQE